VAYIQGCRRSGTEAATSEREFAAMFRKAAALIPPSLPLGEPAQGRGVRLEAGGYGTHFVWYICVSRVHDKDWPLRAARNIAANSRSLVAASGFIVY